MNCPIYHILYLDDSQVDRECVREALVGQGGAYRFLLTEAASREEFTYVLTARNYDIVLLDINIFGFSGLLAMDEVRKVNPRLPIVIVTGTGSEETAVEAMKRGATDYVIKTSDHIRRLPLIIRAAIEQSELKQQHERAEIALRRISRARAVMAACNHAMIHAESETQLLQEMCRVVVESGGYKMAWIGFVDDPNRLGVIPISYAGSLRGDLSALAACGVAEHDQDNPTALVLRDVCSHVCVDIAQGQGSVRDAVWRRFALNQGYRSVTALPLKDKNQVLGVLAIYEQEPHEFDPDQLELFEELADDIAYGVVTLRTRNAREHADQALRATEDKLAAILNSIDNIVWSASESGLLYANPVLEKIYGRPLADFYQDKNLWFSVVHPDDRNRLTDAFSKLQQGGALTQQYRIIRPDGEVRWLEDRIKAVMDERGNVLRFDGVASDISERKQYEGRIEYLATHDALTGLANRHLLGDRLAQAIARSSRSQHLLALLFLDIDRFKDINDSFGHVFGDQLLQQVAVRLKENVREGDTVSRQGGDEFIIVLTDLQKPEDVVVIASKILHAFSSPFIVGSRRLYVTTSIGATLYPNDSTDIETLLKNADIAMYRAKRESGNDFRFYSSEMSVTTKERVELETALRWAVERQEFELFYQPKVALNDGRVVGVEALIRWHHPDLGLVSPVHFIPMAEELGLIVPIGKWVLRTACSQLKQWQEAGLPPITVSVNISARQFRQEGLVKAITDILQETGLDPRYLELELTESMVLNSADKSTVTLHELKALGVELSIDDFGTGYSNLSYLKRFPVDRLKIDQSFVQDIVNDSDDAAIAYLIISLGHSLNLKVIAEGVETAEQLAFLHNNHCDEIQGYYCSQPVSANDFVSLMHNGLMRQTVYH